MRLVRCGCNVLHKYMLKTVNQRIHHFQRVNNTYIIIIIYIILYYFIVYLKNVENHLQIILGPHAKLYSIRF